MVTKLFLGIILYEGKSKVKTFTQMTFFLVNLIFEMSYLEYVVKFLHISNDQILENTVIIVIWARVYFLR